MQYKVETTSLGRYLDDVDDGDVKLDQAVQRDFCWSKGMMNALIYSAVSKEIYIPPIILAEQKKKKMKLKQRMLLMRVKEQRVYISLD